MPLTRLDHLNIATTDLDRCRTFYQQVLGLEDGPRPRFARPGAWLYLDGHPVVHVSTGRKPATRKSDSFDHVAFTARDLPHMRAHLKQLGVDHYEVAVPDRELLQIFMSDPDGNEVELVFGGEEARQAIREGATVDRTKLRPQEAPDPVPAVR